jgi:hypothetical protein
MPHPVTFLCLMLAFAGQPLRQVEAASDLSRAFGRLWAPDTIEVPDGGVGDDSGAATLQPGTSRLPTPTWGESDLVGLFDALREPFSHCYAGPDALTSHWRQQPATAPPIGQRARHAWLQLFLI